ncbi:MAG: NTP transferase domain-containing protein [Alphaproteobacteria bacterium]|nr:NTP transferase domain-containing protein [Alphaproteobacteria bacterium]
MSKLPEKAFVLAAGQGQRMRPLTDNCPKPLLYVGERTMLDRALDALEEAGVEEAVVNLHYLGDMIEEHLKARPRPRIIFSREEQALETGGGVQTALSHFGDEPFFVLNADVVWTDGEKGSVLRRMAEMWDGDKMDLILLLHPAAEVPAYAGKGDYYLAEGADKPVFKTRAQEPANYIFAGPRLVHPRLFEGVEPGSYSFLDLFHKAEAAGRLYALRHDGDWYHVGTPEALEDTNRLLAAREKKRAP